MSQQITIKDLQDAISEDRVVAFQLKGALSKRMLVNFNQEFSIFHNEKEIMTTTNKEVALNQYNSINL